MAVRIEPRGDNEWKVYFDDTFPSVLRIEDHELRALYDVLAEQFGRKLSRTTRSTKTDRPQITVIIDQVVINH